MIKLSNIIKAGATGLIAVTSSFITGCGDNRDQNQHSLPSQGYLERFVSQEGRHAFPIQMSKNYAIFGLGHEEAIAEFVRKNSRQNLWTGLMVPENHVVDGKIVAELQTGTDALTRIYRENETATILIRWRPSISDVRTEFEVVKGSVINADKTWIAGSDEDILVGGQLGRKGRYLSGNREYNTCVSTQKDGRSFMILFSFMGGYETPDNTFSKVLRGFEFDAKK